jgi:hypothetical protein
VAFSADPSFMPTGDTPRSFLVSLAAVALCMALLAWCAVAPESLHQACREDGWFEAGSVLAFCGAAAALVAASRVRRAGERRRAVRGWLLLLALLCLVFAGEELSWGQRLFGFETPECVRAVNEQDELNLHNLKGLHRVKYSLLVGAIAALMVATIVGRAVPRLRHWVGRRGIPLLAFGDLVWFAAALLFLRHVANWLDLVVRNDAQEIGEFFFALGLLAFAVRAWVLPRSVEVGGPEPERGEDGGSAGLAR